MSEASYHLRSKAIHNVMDTNLNIQKSQKTDEQNLSWLFSSPIFTPSTLGGKQRMKTVLGKKISTCFLWTVFHDSVPISGTMQNTIPVLEQAFCQSSAAEPLHQWRKARELNSDSEPSATKKKYKGIGFCNCENWIQLKINQELNGKSIASLSCFC